MVIIINGTKKKVSVSDNYLEGTFLETLYEWFDDNDIYVEFDKDGG